MSRHHAPGVIWSERLKVTGYNRLRIRPLETAFCNAGNLKGYLPAQKNQIFFLKQQEYKSMDEYNSLGYNLLCLMVIFHLDFLNKSKIFFAQRIWSLNFNKKKFPGSVYELYSYIQEKCEF